jgi:hypothetical protein
VWHSNPLRGGADKSLDRPGRKQSTASKLGIYSTYSQQSSIRFLARCSNFCMPLKKIRILSIQPGLQGSNDLRLGRKIATFQLFFQSMEQIVVRRGQNRRTGWVIKTVEAQVGHNVTLRDVGIVITRDSLTHSMDQRPS